MQLCLEFNHIAEAFPQLDEAMISAGSLGRIVIKAVCMPTPPPLSPQTQIHTTPALLPAAAPTRHTHAGALCLFLFGTFAIGASIPLCDLMSSPITPPPHTHIHSRSSSFFGGGGLLSVGVRERTRRGSTVQDLHRRHLPQPGACCALRAACCVLWMGAVAGRKCAL